MPILLGFLCIILIMKAITWAVLTKPPVRWFHATAALVGLAGYIYSIILIRRM